MRVVVGEVCIGDLGHSFGVDADYLRVGTIVSHCRRSHTIVNVPFAFGSLLDLAATL